MQGFHWSDAHFFNKEFKCNELESFYGILAAITILKSERSRDEAKIIRNCLNSLGGDRREILKFANGPAFTPNQLDRYLKKSQFTEKKNKMIKIIGHKKNNNSQHYLFELFIKYINNNKKGIKVNLKNIKEEVKRVEKERPSFIRNILIALIAFQAENRGWGNRMLEEILFMGPKKIIFEPHYNNKKKYLNALYYFIEHYVIRIDHKKLSKIFILYVSVLLENPKVLSFKKNWGVDWPLAEMREYLKSINFGEKYAAAWALILQKRISDAELKAFLRKTLENNSLSRLRGDSLWMFKHLTPLSKKLKGLFENLIKKNRASRNQFFHFNLIEMLENNQLRKIIVKHIPLYAGAPFKIKRNFYLSLLEDGIAINFALYNLIKLGDRNEKYLWWIII